MKKNKLLLIVSFLLITGVAFGQTQWKFDKSHSKIQFTATHMKISEVTGQFKEYSGTITAGEEDFTDADIKITIPVSSIDTDNEKRDGHLKGEDFFNVSKYPEIKFVSESLTKVEGKNYKLKGMLTIKDVTKMEEFDVKYMGTVDAMGAIRAGFKITGKIDRFDYNIDWDRSFGQGLVVGRDIGIKVDVELIKE